MSCLGYAPGRTILFSQNEQRRNTGLLWIPSEGDLDPVRLLRACGASVIRSVRHVSGRSETSWTTIGALVAFISLWQGFGYALGGKSFTHSRGWMPLLAYERNLHVHGIIMLLLGFAVAVQLRGPFSTSMLWTLRALRTYCLIVAACWFGSWITYGVSWGAPGWWVLLAALTVWLSWFAPPVVASRAIH